MLRTFYCASRHSVPGTTELGVRLINIMNREQKEILKTWLVLAVLVLVLALIHAGDIERKQLLTLVVGGPIFLYLTSLPDVKNHQEFWRKNNYTLGKLIEENISLKLWLIFTCIFILPFIIYNLYKGGGSSSWLYALAFVLLIGPIIVVSEIQRFKRARNNT